MSKRATDNVSVRDAWDTNARFWDERIWPSIEKLLRPQPCERLLDVACGNGVTSRRLAQAGATVVACDFSKEMIRMAVDRGGAERVEYRVVDATDTDEL